MFKDFYKAWRWLDNHPYWYNPETEEKYQHLNTMFQKSLFIMVVKVNPLTGMIDDDINQNCATRVWLETGNHYIDRNSPWSTSPVLQATHDWRLDCGGSTYEKAIIELANLVQQYIGDYQLDVDGRCLNWKEKEWLDPPDEDE